MALNVRLNASSLVGKNMQAPVATASVKTDPRFMLMLILIFKEYFGLQNVVKWRKC